MSQTHTSTTAKADLMQGCSAQAQKQLEQTFTRKLVKEGWFTYTDDETGRVVTNATHAELDKLSSLTGMPCEVVSSWAGNGCKVGPRLQANDLPILGGPVI